MANFTLPDGHNYFVDDAGRLLIFSCGIDGLDLKDPRTVTKTTGKVLPASNTCIDDLRWQYIRNTLASSSDNWRLAVATTDSTSNEICDSDAFGRPNQRGRILNATTRNIAIMKTFNVRALPSSLTDWVIASNFNSLIWCWDENSGSDATGEDYSGILFQSPTVTPGSPYQGFGIYSQSSKPPYGTNQFSYFHRTLEFWILPPGRIDFQPSRVNQYGLDSNGLFHNPGHPSSNHTYGWFVRTGGTNTSPLSNGAKPFQGDCRQLVLVWNGVVILDSEVSPIIVSPAQGTSNDFTSWGGAGTTVIGNKNYTYTTTRNVGVVVGNYVYYAGEFMGAEYGWPIDGVSYSASAPSADYCNGYKINRRRYYPSTPIYTGNKSNGQTSITPNNATNILFDINGGRGGNGGTGIGGVPWDGGSRPGGSGGYGQRIIGYITPANIAKTFTHYVGGNGSTGSLISGANGGSGGIASGNRGGSGTGGTDSYGAGGGGGGAASALQGNSLMIAAGGGGGGGGMSYGYLWNMDAEHVSYFTFASSSVSITSGFPGSDAGSSNNSGGGGGGGGASGGTGGSAIGSGHSTPGEGGNQGGGYADSDEAETAYEVPDWIGTTYWPHTANQNAFGQITPYYTNFVNEFGSSTRNTNWGPNGKVELYYYTLNAQTYANEVGVRLKIYDNGLWIPVKEMYVKDGSIWKLVQDCYIKKDGTWQPFYG